MSEHRGAARWWASGGQEFQELADEDPPVPAVRKVAAPLPMRHGPRCRWLRTSKTYLKPRSVSWR